MANPRQQPVTSRAAPTEGATIHYTVDGGTVAWWVWKAIVLMPFASLVLVLLLTPYSSPTGGKENTVPSHKRTVWNENHRIVP